MLIFGFSFWYKNNIRKEKEGIYWEKIFVKYIFGKELFFKIYYKSLNLIIKR